MIDAEKAVLGALISGYDDEELPLRGVDFSQPVHEVVWDAVRQIRSRGERPDMVKVRAAIANARLPMDAGVFVAELVEACPVPASAPAYAQLVAEAADRRGLASLADRIRQLAESDRDPADLIEDARALLDKAPRRVRDEGADWDTIIPTVIDRIEQGSTAGLPTPWPDLNNVLHGLVGGRLYLIAGRPGGGKSVMGQNIATHLAKAGHGIYVASMEMTSGDYGIRIVADQAGVALDKILEGRDAVNDIEWHKISTAQKTLAGLPLRIQDRSHQTVAEIRSGARDMARKRGLSVIIIDYLQQIRPTDAKAPRHEQVGEISRSLKTLARELDVPVLAMSQLNRGPLNRADKTPNSGDLRESGALEADADVVLLLHREDPMSGEIKVIPDKNRWGAQTAVTLQFWGHYARLASSARNWSPSSALGEPA